MSEKNFSIGSFIMAIITIISAIASVLALRFAWLAYENDIEDYTLLPFYELSESGLRIKNNNPELFEITQVYVTKYDQIRVKKSNVFNLSNLTFACSSEDEDNPNMDNIFVNFSVPSKFNGEVNDVTGFQEWYDIKMKELDANYYISPDRRIIEVLIEYSNKRNFKRMALQMDLYITEDYKIKGTWDGELNSSRYDTTRLIENYDPEIAEEDWQFFMQKVYAAQNAEEHFEDE